MAKNSTSVYGDDNNDDKYPLEEDKFEQSKTPENKKYPSKTVLLKHNRNTKKELHIGREVYTFWGAETLEVPASVITHKDFENQKKYFLVKEV